MIEAKEVDNDAISKDTESEGKIEREVKDTTEPQPGTSNQDDDNRRKIRQNFPYTPWTMGGLQQSYRPSSMRTLILDSFCKPD